MFLNDPSGHQGGEQSRETSGRERPLGNPGVVASVGEGRGVGCGGIEEMSVMFIKWAELRDKQAVEVEERRSKAVAKSGGSTPPPKPAHEPRCLGVRGGGLAHSVIPHLVGISAKYAAVITASC